MKGFLLLIVVLGVLLSQPVSSEPTVTITGVPALGQWWHEVQGRFDGGNFSDYVVAPLIYIPGAGWFSKPYCDDGFHNPYFTLYSNTFSRRINTGGMDDLAPIIEFYLIPKASYPACYPSCVINGSSVPDSLVQASVDNERFLRPGVRVIRWSGYEWMVKQSVIEADDRFFRVDPGQNYFSASTNNVWIDDQGQLHLKILQVGDKWTCAEVQSLLRLGYGTYSFDCASRVDNLDPNAVFGLFTWSDYSNPASGGNREIDVEFSRWSNPSNQNSQYVVQPAVSGNIRRFNMPAAEVSRHTFVWRPDRISFQSTISGQATPVQSWEYTNLAGIPPSLDERVHLNLWLYKSAPPSNGLPVEVVLSDFQFEPYRTQPVYGSSIRGMSDPVASALSLQATMKIWGKVISRDTAGFVVSDGSANPIKVLELGHQLNVGDYVAVEGKLVGGNPKTIVAATGRITVFTRE